MIDETIDLQQLSFIKVTLYVCKHLKWANYFFIFIFFLTIFMALFIDLTAVFFFFFPIYLFGIVLSLAIHEYTHIFFIKKLTDHKQIRVLITWDKFALVPLTQIKGLKSIIIACSGSLSCVLIAGILLFLRAYFRPTDITLLFLVICYGIHGFSLLPIFGDGLMILKGIVDLLKGGESK